MSSFDSIPKLIMQGKCPCNKGYIEKYKYYHEEYDSWPSWRDGDFTFYKINCPDCQNIYKIKQNPVNLTLEKCSLNIGHFKSFSIYDNNNTNYFSSDSNRYMFKEKENVIVHKSISYDQYKNEPNALLQLSQINKQLDEIVNGTHYSDTPFPNPNEYWNYCNLANKYKNMITIPEWMSLAQCIKGYRHFFWEVSISTLNKNGKQILIELLNQLEIKTNIKEYLDYQDIRRTCKFYNTKSIKKIRQVFQVYLDLLNVIQYPIDITNLYSSYAELGNNYYQDFITYKTEIEQSQLKIELQNI